MKNKKAITSTEINEAIANRWSPRSFKPNKEVSKKQIMALLEAARWAPSCFGDEPWKFMIFNKYDNEEAYNKALGILNDWNRQWAKNAPVLIVALADRNFRNGKANRWAEYDTGQAVMSLAIQASSLGLVSHQMGGFDSEKLKIDFDISDQYIPMSFISVGYQDEAEKLNTDLKKREVEERKRRPIEDNFFFDNWNL